MRLRSISKIYPSLFSIIFLLVIASARITKHALAGERIIVKNARQYYLDLSRRLELNPLILFRIFDANRSNSPKSGDLSGLGPSIDGLARIANAGCAELQIFEGNYMNIDKLYLMILDRKPTDDEKLAAVRDETGKDLLFPNCFMLAMHPEFILVRGYSQ
ncbi:MAG: hypothetical protein KDD35_03780 [Bdellovibrionales bacterium]|nr:hypothetical protein [Bdellovibrionales bacterium]